MELLYIHWNPDPVIISVLGFSLRWYSLLWMIAIASGCWVVYRLYKRKKWDESSYQNLVLYSFLGIFVGARLGHCLFYEPGYYLTHFWEIVLPVRSLPDGGYTFVGYAGLASHGGVIGILIALLLFCRRYKIHYLDILDMMGIAAPIVACFIRLANLMNSEILGMPTDASWAFVFERADLLPRHPAQLYEALAYLMIFFIIQGIVRYKKENYTRGLYFGLCLTLIFIFRFFVEFIKADQVAFEDGLTFNMGQLLSIPFVLIGGYFMIKGWKSPVKK